MSEQDTPVIDEEDMITAFLGGLPEEYKMIQVAISINDQILQNWQEVVTRSTNNMSKRSELVLKG